MNQSMNNYTDLAIAAIPVVNVDDLDEDDGHVPAVYSVMVKRELSPSDKASAALDVFHSKCGISVLDDFEFYVFDPETGLVLGEGEDHESYSMTSYGRDVERIADVLPGIYSIRIEAVGAHEAADLGLVTVAASDEQEANGKALAALWDARLDSASCSPRYETERLR